MVTSHFLLLLAACLAVHALPPKQARTTIFGDERLEGQVFEYVDNDIISKEVELYNEVNPYRLPTTTRPVHYNILWIIDIDRLTYSGTVEIILEATQGGVSEIVLHSGFTDDGIVSLQLSQGNNSIPHTYRQEAGYQFLIIRPNIDLEYNEAATSQVQYTLTISFEAEMREDMYGIYKSWFVNGGNDTTVRWMASTQFQATSARYAFPCYDEPSFKATFDITIRRPITHRSWSCTRSTTIAAPIAAYEDDVYARTPIMSTYLLALIVAEYESQELIENNLLIYEVIARPGAIQDGQGQYAFDVGQELLAYMNDHTAINFYSVNENLKMTQASIPDFSAGAMENWGLLTYREAYLMYSEEHTNSYNKQLIAYILSHEIAHMWFGNLVTCDWWDDLWLNEGFARYYQYFLTHWVEDYMGLETRFITEQIHTSLLSDSANNPHPLSNPGVGSPAAVSAMFTTISYNKGAAVIRMTEHLLGFDVNRIGLQNYLVNKSFQTALPIDLMESLENAGQAAGALEYGPDFSFVEYYKSWTEQSGHPVLLVQVNHQTGDIIINQRRFNINTGFSTATTNWVVPITFATASNPDFNNTKPTHVIKDSLSVINRGTTGDEWIIFNKQQTGFYRVNYDDYTWDLIVLALRGEDRNIIHEYNKAQIVNDVFQFARSGIMTYTRALNILSFLEFENQYAPWVAAMTGFTWVRQRFAGTTQLTDIENLIVRWAANVINEISYYPTEGETFMRSYLRYQLAPVMCNIGVEACRTAAFAQFRQLADNGIQVPVDSRNWVYCNALREGTTADFDFLWQRYLDHNVHTEKLVLLQTLGCTPHQTSLYTLLDAIVLDNSTSPSIRPQDYTTALNTVVSGNEANTQISFTYMQNNLAALTNRFNNVATPLSYVSARLRTEAEIVAFQTWATQNQAALGNSYASVYNGAESARWSIQFAASISNDLNNYIVVGNEVISTTTEAFTTPVVVNPVPQPDLTEPEAPSLTDSAASVFFSTILITLAAAINVVF